jgi:hypothetical protein
LKADLDASLGSVAAFFGFLAPTFSILLVLTLAVRFQPVFTLSAVIAGCGLSASWPGVAHVG